MTRLDELLLKWQDRALSAAEFHELNGRLSHPEARARLVQEFAFSEDLTETLRLARVEVAARAQAGEFETAEVRAAQPAARPVSWRAAWVALGRWHLGFSAGAAVFAIGLLCLLLFSPEPLGRLEQVSGSVTVERGGDKLRVSEDGLRLRSGDIVTTATGGEAVVVYGGEPTRLRIGGGASFLVDTSDEGKIVELRRGTLEGSIAPQPPGQPMTFRTPHASAAVLGTELALTVDGGSTRLDVLEGSVRLERRTDGEAIHVTAGFQAETGQGIALAAHPLMQTPWKSQDIGNASRPGHARWDGKKCSVVGSGRDARRERDEFHFVYQTLDGDGEIRARVLQFDAKDKRTKAGVVVRESLKSGAPTAFLRVHAGRGLEFVRRYQQGSRTDLVGPARFPYWVRLERRGDTITAYKSTDGVTWNATGSAQFDLGHRIYVGLGVASSEKSPLRAAVFDNISVLPHAGGGAE